jgi:hypothetical protein
MPTRWILFGLKFFAASAAVASAIAVLGPMPGIRFFGYVALTCALAGTVLHVFVLRDADPHAWRVLRHRASSFAERAGLRFRVALPRHDLREMQP